MLHCSCSSCFSFGSPHSPHLPLQGGGFYVLATSYPTLQLIDTAIYRCTASTGAGLHVVSGTVELSNRSRFFENVATSADGSSSYLIDSGVVTYALPAPDAHWLPNGICQAYRQGCPAVRINSTDVPDPDCLAIFEECRFLPGNTPQAANGKHCTPRMPYTQPCNWIDSPEKMGKPIYRLPFGREEQEFPYACAPG